MKKTVLATYRWHPCKSQLARHQALSRMAKDRGWLSVARVLTATANFVRDPGTRRTARADAKYAFGRYHRAKQKR